MSTYSAAVIALGPLAYWRLNDTAGPNAVDSSGHGYTGTYEGGVTYSSASLLNSDPDKAVTLNGSTGDMQVSTYTVPGLNDVFTIEAWVKPASTSTDMCIHSQDIGGAGLHIASGGQVTCYVENAPQIANSGSTTLVAGNTYHVVWTKNGATNHLYVNGVDVIANIVNATCATAAGRAMSVGSSQRSAYGGLNWFNGVIDEVALYGFALTAAQVTTNYNNGSAVTLTPGPYRAGVLALNPNAYWRLDDATGTAMVDSSPNARNGTYHGGFTLGAASLLTSDADKAVALDGSTGYGQAGTDASMGDVFTLEAWIKPTTVAARQCMLTGGPNSPSIEISAAGLLVGLQNYYSVPATGVCNSGSTLVTANVRHHCVWTKNGTNNHLYLDGVEVTTLGTNATITSFGYGTWVGCDYNSATTQLYCNGVIDEVAYYNFALTFTQVRQNYLNGTTAPTVDQGVFAGAATAGMTIAGTVTRLGVAPLAATAGMTIAGTVARVGVAALAATAGMTVAGTVTKLGVAPLAATAGMTATGTSTQFGTVPLAATAGMTVTGTRTQLATVPLSGTAGMTVAAAVTKVAAIALSATTSLTITAGTTAIQQGSVTLASTTGMTVGASVTQIASVIELAAAGQMVISSVLEQAAVTETATAGMTVAASVTQLAAVSLAGGTSLNVSALITEVAAVSLSGTTGMTAAASVTELASVSMSGTAGLTATGHITQIISPAFSATAGMTVSSSVTEIATISLAATAGLVVAATAVGLNGVVFSASTGLAVTPVVTELASVAMAAVGGMTTAGTTTQVASVILSALAGMTIASTITEVASATMVGSASLTVAVGQSIQTATVLLTGTAALVGIPLPVIINAQVAMASSTGMALAGMITEVTGVVLSATANLTVSSGLFSVIQGQVAMASLAGLNTDAAISRTATISMSAVASLTTMATITLTGQPALVATSGMTISASVVEVVRVDMVATTSMTVSAVVEMTKPTLADHIIAVSGEDPMQLGATGYADKVFSQRMMADTE